MTNGNEQTIVLVHGAWHGGWCYWRVADLLRRGGHRVYTPTLTGLGERSHLLTRSIDLSTHIADIVNLIRWEDLQRIILVGHSYGGMVVTGVADAMAGRISALVYLDAFLPTAGKSFHDIVPTEVAEDFARSMRNEPSCISYELPCGHDVMIDLPKETAAIIEETAARVVTASKG